jgi:hypothetical protein
MGSSSGWCLFVLRNRQSASAKSVTLRAELLPSATDNLIGGSAPLVHGIEMAKDHHQPGSKKHG